jgi:hypothetical protein
VKACLPPKRCKHGTGQRMHNHDKVPAHEKTELTVGL